ncbi:hypothetical protein CALCODRAFT_481171 [Calocera cornea HHB12733]|uniref:Replication factor-A protein 1 N-terminal domain-containing protein n=1 Tax=Calocera cornea HHB12733 TaxID=1353952 RepID=A0A165HXC3_9BASI|nr:hypothetical protein CALCODRAFT_481171 [Calocera cornea HHB12733]
MTFDLVNGTCAALLDDSAPPSRYVQVLKVEQVAVGGLKLDPEQYRITISDGSQCIPVMLGMDLNKMVSSSQLAPLAVVCIEDYLWVNVCTLRIVILTEVTVVARPSQVIGSKLELLNVSTDPANVMETVAKYLDIKAQGDMPINEDASSDTCGLSNASTTDESVREADDTGATGPEEREVSEKVEDDPVAV